MRKYLRIFYLLTSYSIESLVATRWAMGIFIVGKLLRLGLFLLFMNWLLSGTGGVLGYTRFEALLFVAVFFLVSGVAQMFFRETYRFRGRVVSGDFDYDLIRPVHPLVKNVFGGFDLQDFLTLPIMFGVVALVIANLNFSLVNLLALSVLALNSFIVILAVHVVIAGAIIIQPEVDHALMIYRDLEATGRFPVDIYKEPIRQFLTFVVPIGLIFTVPAKAFLGLLSWPAMGAAVAGGVISLYLAVRFWDFAVKRYTSASS